VAETNGASLALNKNDRFLINPCQASVCQLIFLSFNQYCMNKSELIIHHYQKELRESKDNPTLKRIQEKALTEKADYLNSIGQTQKERKELIAMFYALGKAFIRSAINSK
jgi:hypothetical protein